MTTVRSRAHRTLRHLNRYEPVDDHAAPGYPVVIEADEHLIGIYRNSVARGGVSVLITDMGLRFERLGAWCTVRYNDMRRVAPWTKDQRELCLELNDGSTVSVPITGGEGKLRDFLAFVRFVNRVLADRAWDDEAP